MKVFNYLLAKSLPIVPKPIIRAFAKPYIGGNTLEGTVDLIRKFNKDGYSITLDFLGESKLKKEDVFKVVDEYKRVLALIHEKNLDSNISIKPTHFGLLFDKQLAKDSIQSLVQAAHAFNNFVRIDMEDTPTTTDTLNIYKQIREKYNNLGVVIQAYLRRSGNDIKMLCDMKANVRLCKVVVHFLS